MALETFVRASYTHAFSITPSRSPILSLLPSCHSIHSFIFSDCSSSSLCLPVCLSLSGFVRLCSLFSLSLYPNPHFFFFLISIFYFLALWVFVLILYLNDSTQTAFIYLLKQLELLNEVLSDNLGSCSWSRFCFYIPIFCSTITFP